MHSNSQKYGVFHIYLLYSMQVYVDFGPSGKFILIQKTIIVMYCSTMPVPTVLPTPLPTVLPTPLPTAVPTLLLTALPTPLATSLPTPTPTIPLPKCCEDMCDSVRNLTNALSAGDTVTGTCNISDTCLYVICDLEIQLGLIKVPVSLTVILLPCQSPFTIYVNAEINLFGQTISLADDNYSGNATIPVSIPFVGSGTVNIVIIQQECGILLSVSLSTPIGHYIA